ncbi:MAG: hypothetical protein JWN04_3235 [Myxococcaceae bacterium]|nr:hypothetical protein [Myxococcaceae bacterium]
MAALDELARTFGVSLAELFVPDDRTPPVGLAAEIDALLAGLSSGQSSWSAWLGSGALAHRSAGGTCGENDAIGSLTVCIQDSELAKL